MSVAEYTKIKIKNDPGRARRVGDARTFQRYAAGIIRLVPATAIAIGRRIAHLMIPLLMVGVTAAGCGGDVQTAGPTAPSPASAKPTIEYARADTGHQGDGRRRQGRPVFSCEGCRSSDLRN